MGGLRSIGAKESHSTTPPACMGHFETIPMSTLCSEWPITLVHISSSFPYSTYCLVVVTSEESTTDTCSTTATVGYSMTIEAMSEIFRRI
jgi:hypothetical protein